jgi:16S rRNA C1402 (ribose-2'-O) methylase RsmI
VKVFGENQNIVVAYKLTMDEEQFLRGSAGKILNAAESKNLKGEFVLLIDNSINGQSKS